MTRKINSVAELAAILEKTGANAKLYVQQAVAASAVQVQSTAKQKFGTYQPSVGEYPAWAPLKEATIAAKAKAGGGEDPLIGHYAGNSSGRTGGQLRGSIVVDIGVLEATVGTNDPVAPHHEFGAPRRNIPPRPYLRPALHENKEKIAAEISGAVAKAIAEQVR